MTDRPSKLRRLSSSDSISTAILNEIDDVDDFDDVSIGRKSNLNLFMGSSYFPKENEFKPKGEDAHFICEDQQVFGIADGVGSWAKKGIDAGQYAWDLMSNCVLAVEDEAVGSAVNPLIVLEEAFSNTRSEGSSTSCIVAMSDDNCIHYANVGDSGFIVIRGEKLIHGSTSQQRRFNCPFQLGNHSHSDNPSVAIESKFEVEEGDIIVAGTDGLFDNLFQEEIIEIVHGFTDLIGMYPYFAARLIAKEAQMNSEDSDHESPFSISAGNAGYYHSGGQKDDITVVVAYVVSSAGETCETCEPEACEHCKTCECEPCECTELMIVNS